MVKRIYILRSCTKNGPKKQKFKNPALPYYSHTEYDYYKNLDIVKRKMIADDETKLVDISQSDVPLRFKIINSDIDIKMKAIAISKIESLSNMNPDDGEYYKTQSWIENLAKIPFGKFKQLAINSSSTKEATCAFINEIKTRMDSSVYGHKDAKAQIVRLLAQWISNPNSKGLAIGIHGPMGCGKTTLIKDAICSVLGLPFGFIPLGGANDGCYIDGHSSTYTGSKWGRIVDILMQTGCMNPVLFFDELDKVSNTEKGEEIINLLIHLTDATQNDKFKDKFFSEFDIDLSRCLVIFSYNDESSISPILRDRIVRIETSGYTLTDKVVISKDHMIPIAIKEHGMDNGNIVFPEETIKYMVDIIEDEKGVRNLKRAIVDVVSNINLTRMLGTVELPYTVTNKDVNQYINAKKKKDTVNMMYI